jgi:hypothetical protein
MSRRSLVARSALAAMIVALAVFLFLAGKGHVLYLDTNSLEAGGRALRAPELAAVSVDGAEPEEMGRAERVIVNVAGPSHEVSIEQLSGEGEKVVRKISLPTSWTEILISIPAILAGAGDELVVTRYVEPEAVDEPAERTVQQDESDVIPLP